MFTIFELLYVELVYFDLSLSKDKRYPKYRDSSTICIGYLLRSTLSSYTHSRFSLFYVL